VRADHEVVVLHHEVVHRDGRQVRLQLLPAGAVVGEYDDAALGAREQQAALLRVLAHGVQVDVLREPALRLLQVLP
jgi:hypothetical protein